MPILVAPIAGVLSDRVGARPLLVVGMARRAAGLGWIAAISTPTVEYLLMVPAFVLAGTGMSTFFAPTANLVPSSVHADGEGRASGANNTIREIGGVFGVAVLASVFAANGSYATPHAFVDGMAPAVWVGAAAVALASIAALAVPGRRLLAGSISQGPGHAPSPDHPAPAHSRSRGRLTPASHPHPRPAVAEVRFDPARRRC